MKIIYICNEYPPHPAIGGIGTFTHTIAHGMVAAGHEVTVVGYGKNAGERDDNGVRVVVLPEITIRGVAWLINRWSLWRWLKHEVKGGNADIIETPEYQGLVPFGIRRCPVVVRLHSSGLPLKFIIRLCEKMTLKTHSNWIAVSNYIYQETVKEYKIAPDAKATIYNPVAQLDSGASVPTNLPEDFVLYAGTVSDRKGAFVLAEAARLFLAKFPNLHLVYAGSLLKEDGLDAEQRIHNIVGAELVKRVHCLGLVDHAVVLECMRKARVFVFPSKLEAFSLVPLEAMSCGIPVVYTSESSGPEAIEDGVTGLLADPYSPDDVAEKTMRILSNQSLAKRLVENAYQSVNERFSLKRCIDETIAFYKSCLDGHLIYHDK